MAKDMDCEDNRTLVTVPYLAVIWEQASPTKWKK